MPVPRRRGRRRARRSRGVPGGWRARGRWRCADAGRRKTGAGRAAPDPGRSTSPPRPSFGPTSRRSIGSRMMSPARLRGFREEYGSWKMNWTRRRNADRASPRRGRTLSPSSRTSPEAGFTRRMTPRATVVLPLPLSPTSPSVRPRSSVKETSSAACTKRWRSKKWRFMAGKRMCRFRTSSKGMPSVGTVMGSSFRTGRP